MAITLSPEPSASELLDTHSAVRDRLANTVQRMAQAIWRPNGREACSLNRSAAHIGYWRRQRSARAVRSRRSAACGCSPGMGVDPRPVAPWVAERPVPLGLESV